MVHIAGEDRGFLAKVKAVVLIPTTTDVNSKRNMAFSLFYTAAVTLPLFSTIVFWLAVHRSITSPGHKAIARPIPVDQIVEAYSFGGRFLRDFLIINLNAFNSVIAFVEILVLSSVRKQKVTSQSNCIWSRSS